MTHDPNSADLEELKTLLAKSYQDEQGDDVPPLPEGLRDRLAGQYGRTSKKEASFLAKVKEGYGRLAEAFAKPAYAGATLAVLVAIIAVTLVNHSKQDTGFRGGMEQAESTRIIFYQVDEATKSTLLASGYFEEGALSTIASAEELAVISPPAIIINGLSREVISKTGSGETSTSFPEDASKLPDLVVTLLQGQ